MEHWHSPPPQLPCPFPQLSASNTASLFFIFLPHTLPLPPPHSFYPPHIQFPSALDFDSFTLPHFWSGWAACPHPTGTRRAPPPPPPPPPCPPPPPLPAAAIAWAFPRPHAAPMLLHWEGSIWTGGEIYHPTPTDLPPSNNGMQAHPLPGPLTQAGWADLVLNFPKQTGWGTDDPSSHV